MPINGQEFRDMWLLSVDNKTDSSEMCTINNRQCRKEECSKASPVTILGLKLTEMLNKYVIPKNHKIFFFVKQVRP